MKGKTTTLKFGFMILLAIGFTFIALRLTSDSIFSQSYLLAGLLAIIVGGIGLYKVMFS